VLHKRERYVGDGVLHVLLIIHIVKLEHFQFLHHGKLSHFPFLSLHHNINEQTKKKICQHQLQLTPAGP
jgi:hypothetical protein